MSFRYFCPYYSKDRCTVRDTPTHCNGHQVSIQIANIPPPARANTILPCSELIEHIRDLIEDDRDDLLDEYLTSKSDRLKTITKAVMQRMKERNGDGECSREEGTTI